MKNCFFKNTACALALCLITSTGGIMSAKAKAKGIEDVPTINSLSYITKNESRFLEKVKPESVVKKVINEYDSFKKLQNKDEKELLKLGWTSSEIKSLKGFDYKEAVIKRSNLPNDTLIKMGYNSSDIKSLKSNDLSEKALSLSSASINIMMGMSIVTNSNCDWYGAYQWGWTKKPIYMMKDIIGVKAIGSVNGGVALPVLMGDSYANVEYIFEGDSWRLIMTDKPGFKKVDLNLAQSVFEMGKVEPLGGGGTGVTGPVSALSGYGMVHFNNTKPMDRLTLNVQYGHSAGTLSPCITIGAPASAGLGITFSKGVTIENSLVESYNPDLSVVN